MYINTDKLNYKYKYEYIFRVKQILLVRIVLKFIRNMMRIMT